MNFSDFIKDNGKRVSKEHYIHLVQVSRADGKIEPSEMDLLHMEGRKFGLTDPEIDKIIEFEAYHNYTPPYSLSEKFEHLYNIAEMIVADDKVTEGERKLLKRFAIEAGFTDQTIPKLMELLLTGIQSGEDEEKLFQKFKRDYLFKD
ncbi:MAG: hypothetical protein WAL29_17880 [Bacteroidales bacterium]